MTQLCVAAEEAAAEGGRGRGLHAGPRAAGGVSARRRYGLQVHQGGRRQVSEGGGERGVAATRVGFTLVEPVVRFVTVQVSGRYVARVGQRCNA